MRQILLNSSGAVIARMPRPKVEAGCVLVRTRYSLISTGTELAALRPQPVAPGENQILSRARLAITYLGLAAKHPRLAVNRVLQISSNVISATFPKRADIAQSITLEQGSLIWEKVLAKEFKPTDAGLQLVTDLSDFGYQAISNPIPITPGMTPIIEINGEVLVGEINIGMLSGDRKDWLGSRSYGEGQISDELIFDCGDSEKFVLVISSTDSKVESILRLANLQVKMAPAIEDGLPQTELNDQGWNVGYSLSGEVVAVGDGVQDFSVGDLVACAGAGKANHADYVSVPVNLVCHVPLGCDLRLAATTTVGAIALQGVRRATPQIGETVCVIGLGLIGQMTAQILQANGIRVIGFDLNQHRLQKALDLGMFAGSSSLDQFRLLTRDLTGGMGCDQVLITAATKSEEPINLSMELVRQKGVVVIVGDIGLNVKREIFYKKEVDLRMSTSYGPGRYDRQYEEKGHDYPYSYVRWTLNRNMGAYMDLIAREKLKLTSLIDKEINVGNAKEAYKELANIQENGPLGVLIHYPDDLSLPPQLTEPTSITLRGFRKSPQGVINYALIGMGAFGTSMIVPMLGKLKAGFFLKALVSRNATAAGNYVRANQVEIFSTDINDVLKNDDISLVVIATRHYEHANLVTAALMAGKDVFVEKPLAVNWEQLEKITTTYASLEQKPLLMVGFNRRFSPALQILDELLLKRSSPLIISYRLNGGYIPLDHWIQTEDGAGRNIGEACHMYDVFRFLAKSKPVNIVAAAIDPKEMPYLKSDNFCATIKYGDGSVGNLVYCALGPKKGMSKERIEIFCDGEAYIVDDFKSLVRASTSEVLWCSDEPQKGHLQQFERVVCTISENASPPIDFDQIVETTAVSLYINDLIT